MIIALVVLLKNTDVKEGPLAWFMPGPLPLISCPYLSLILWQSNCLIALLWYSQPALPFTPKLVQRTHHYLDMVRRQVSTSMNTGLSFFFFLMTRSSLTWRPRISNGNIVTIRYNLVFMSWQVVSKLMCNVPKDAFLSPRSSVSITSRHTHGQALATWHFPERVPDSGTWGRQYWLADVLVFFEEHCVQHYLPYLINILGGKRSP